MPESQSLNLSNTSDFIYKPIFLMRLFGLVLVGAVVMGLSILGKISFDVLPVVLIIHPYVLVSTSLFWIFGVRKKKSQAVFYFFRWADLLVFSVVIYLSGGTHSPLSLLYLIIILSTAMVSTRELVMFSVLSILSYGLIAYTDFYKATGFLGFEADEVTNISLFIAFSVIAAVQSSYYFSRIKAKDKQEAQLKDQFLFMTVHDLRSPANKIKWEIEKYSSPEFKQKYPEIQEDVRVVDDAVGRMLNLVENLLTLAKGRQIKVTKETIEIPALIKGVINELQPAIIQKHLNVELSLEDDLPSVLANKALLQEAFTNIIGNGVKYNSANGGLSIKTVLDGSFITTTFINTGPKIPADVMGKLFTPYFRGAQDGKTPGTGLGLYITKEIIEQLGGRVGIESSTDKFTVFYISLPYLKGSA